MLFRNISNKKYLKICTTGFVRQKELTVTQNYFTDTRKSCVHHQRQFYGDLFSTSSTRILNQGATVRSFNKIAFSFIVKETKN